MVKHTPAARDRMRRCTHSLRTARSTARRAQRPPTPGGLRRHGRRAAAAAHAVATQAACMPRAARATHSLRCLHAASQVARRARAAPDAACMGGRRECCSSGRGNTCERRDAPHARAPGCSAWQAHLTQWYPAPPAPPPAPPWAAPAACRGARGGGARRSRGRGPTACPAAVWRPSGGRTGSRRSLSRPRMHKRTAAPAAIHRRACGARCPQPTASPAPSARARTRARASALARCTWLQPPHGAPGPECRLRRFILAAACG